MAGADIHCGTFQGADKSGTALEAVLDALDPQAREVVTALKQQFDNDDYVLIEVEQARRLLPFLNTCRTQLIAEIGHDDWLLAEREEYLPDPVAAKWGASKGWRLYCVTDLIGACEHALVERKPVCIAFS